MKQLNRQNFQYLRYPTKIIQFGEGNFLRAFVDWQLDILNEKTELNAGIAIVRPIDTPMPPSLNTQDGLYTTIIRGLNDKGDRVKDVRIIRSVNQEINIYHQYNAFLQLAHDANIEFIFSNTTEAGISYHDGDKFDDQPPKSYPAKLTRLLYERFTHFNGAKDRGLAIIPCELIDYNGQALHQLVLRYAQEWQLPTAFIDWINHANHFYSTLVDRIVTGYPKNEAESLQQELGYRDQFLDTAEYFYLFVIQGDKRLSQQLHLDKAQLNILLVDDIKPYKERKVAILNGAHTAMVPIAYLANINHVGQAMQDETVRTFIEAAIYQEIIPVLSLPTEELNTFAQAVIKRFQNPYIEHQLLSIALNSMTKYRTRILPQLLAYQDKYQRLPMHLTFALSALIVFYRGKRGNETIPLQDEDWILALFKDLWTKHDNGQISTQQLVEHVLSQSQHWQTDLMAIANLAETVTKQIDLILAHGMTTALQQAFILSETK